MKVTLGILSSSLTTFITADCNFSISSNPIWCTSSGVIPLVIVKVIYPKYYKHSNKSFTFAVFGCNFARVSYFWGVFILFSGTKKSTKLDCTLAESFYSVKYGLSNIPSNIQLLIVNIYFFYKIFSLDYNQNSTKCQYILQIVKKNIWKLIKQNKLFD
jgi:hypothetical protein